MSKSMWMVRAQRGGRLFDEFESKSLVAIGWEEMGNMAHLQTRQEFSAAVAQAWPGSKPGQVAASAGQAFRFVREIKQGDRVVTYDPSERVYLIGTISGDYAFDPSQISDNANIRRVSWSGRVFRDQLTVSTRNSLGAISTLFLVPSEAAAELESRLKGGALPVAEENPVEESEDADSIFKDVQDRAFEFIKDKINTLDWEELQELVAGLLRAMGYKTRISPRGPDQGKDIVASPDGFGFESPRIVVEVKHRSGSAMRSEQIRSFLGGRHKDDKGLYVSTGGFSKDARYEAERASIPLTLMDSDDLVQAILEHYEQMDSDSQRLIPLRKVYWPS